MSVCLIDYTVDIGGWAPWVQAIGSVAAIVTAVAIAWRQGVNARKQFAREAKSARKLAEAQHGANVELARFQIKSENEIRSQRERDEVMRHTYVALSMVESIRVSLAQFVKEGNVAKTSRQLSTVWNRVARGGIEEAVNALYRLDMTKLPSNKEVHSVIVSIRVSNTILQLIDGFFITQVDHSLAFKGFVSKIRQMGKLLDAEKEKLSQHMIEITEEPITIPKGKEGA